MSEPQPANASGSASTRRSTRPKNTPKASKASSPVVATQTDPWRSSDELPYIEEENIPRDVDLSQPVLIPYLCSKAFSVPPREVSSNVPLFKVTTRDGAVVSLPRGYRVPLMFVAKFQWDSLKLVLTSSDPQKEWDEYKLDIVHLSRLCHHLFAQAEDAKKKALAKGAKGIDRLWRSATFDRVLTRFYHRWFISRDRFLRLFWEEFDADEYENDILKHDWVRWSVKGHKGFTLTKDEIQYGVTAQQFMFGLEKNAQGGWFWTVDQATSSSATQPSTSSSTETVPNVREPDPNAEIYISKLDKLFGIRKISDTLSHNTLEVKKEQLELHERMKEQIYQKMAAAFSIFPPSTDSPSPEDIAIATTEISQQSTTPPTPPAAPANVIDPPMISSALPPQKDHVSSTEKPSDSTQPPASTTVKPKKRKWPIQARKSVPWRDIARRLQIQRRASPSSSEEESSTDEDNDDVKDGDYKGPRKRVKTSHRSSSSSKVDRPSSTAPKKTTKLLPVVTLKVPNHSQPRCKASKSASDSSRKKQGGSQATSTSNTIPRIISREILQAWTPISLPATGGLAAPNTSDSSNSGLCSVSGNASTAIDSASPSPNAQTQNTVGSPIEPSSLPTTNPEPDTTINHTPTHTQLEISISGEKTSGPTQTSEERVKDGVERVDFRHGSVSRPKPGLVESGESPPNPPLSDNDDQIASISLVRSGRSTSPPSPNHANGGEGLSTPLLSSDANRDNDLTQTSLLTPHLGCSVSPASRSIVERREELTNGTLLTSSAEQDTLATTPPPLRSGRSVSPPTITSVVLAPPISAVPSTLSGPSLDPPVSSQPPLLPKVPPRASLLSADPQASINPLPSQDNLSQPAQEINATCPLPSSSCNADLQVSPMTTPIHSKPPDHPSLVSTATIAPKCTEQDDRMDVDESMTGNVPVTSVSDRNKLRSAILLLRHLIKEHNGFSATEFLDLLVKCSGLLSAYDTVYSGRELQVKLGELDSRLYQEHNALDMEMMGMAVQIVPRPCMLLDKGVDTFSLNMSGLLPVNGEATGLHRSFEGEHEALRHCPPVTREPLTPDATMVDLSSLQQPPVVSPHPDVMKTEAPSSGSEFAPTATRVMTSIMRNMADLLDYSSGGHDVKGKGRMVDDVGTTKLTDGLPIVSALLQEFKVMKEDMQKSLETNRAEMDSVVRFHRMEVNALKDELRASEDRYRREAEILRQRHRQEIESLMDTLREAQKDRESASAEVESSSPMFELIDLRRRILALEGHTRSLPMSPSHPGPSTRPLFEDESDVTITRRTSSHPLGHLFETDEGFVPPTPLFHRPSSDGIASVSKPGTPIQYDREASNAIVIDDSIPLPIKSQRKFVHRFSVT